MTEIDIHVVTADDIDDLLVSVAGLFREDAGTHDSTMDITWPARGGAEYYSGLVGTDDCLLTLARTGTATVGHLVGKLNASGDLRTVAVAVLESMRVDPAARDSGVGGRLVDHFLAWGRANGAKQASVTAFAANEGAQRFYRRHGFAPMSVTLRQDL